jgi:cobalt/nickel transport protein
MKNLLRPFLSLVLLGLFGLPGRAHYHMLLPRSASVNLAKAVIIDYQWGHPFEHQLFDAQVPRSLFVLAPDGKRADLGKTLEPVKVPNGEKQARAYRLRFTPRQRGDFLFVLDSAPVFMKEEKVFFQDTVKVVLHVEDQEGWDARAGQAFELVPLTRPYGLQPGMVFQAEVFGAAGKPVPKTLVEIERYNAAAPRKLPADEQITRTAKTDANGVVTCTLLEPGWWCLTAARDGGIKKHDQKAYPVKQRTTFWVYVDEKITAKK